MHYGGFGGGMDEIGAWEIATTIPHFPNRKQYAIILSFYQILLDFAGVGGKLTLVPGYRPAWVIRLIADVLSAFFRG
jgi:hypothetical protein